MREKRQHPRVVVGGNAQITSISSGSLPEGRATILNCSRGGALLRLEAPKRRLFGGSSRALAVQDSLSCTLRVPPHYQEIDLLAEVVRVEQPAADPQGLHVGLRFFLPEAPLRQDPNVARLRRVLGKAGLSQEVPALPEPALPASERKTQRLETQSSSRATRTFAKARRSARLESTSQRLSRHARELSGEQHLPPHKRPSETGEVPGLGGRRISSRIARIERELESEERELEGEVRELASESESIPAPRAPSESDVADALRTDLFGEESWSNYFKDLVVPGEAPAEAEAPAAPRPSEPPQVPTPASRERRVRVVDHRAEQPAQSARTERPRAEQSARTARAEHSARSERATPRAEAPRPATPPVIYSSLGGPENGIYCRGSAELSGGEALVRFPDHFMGLVEAESITVQITPRGNCRGLYVGRVTPRGMIVRELAEGTSDAPFDYLVLGARH